MWELQPILSYDPILYLSVIQYCTIEMPLTVLYSAVVCLNGCTKQLPTLQTAAFLKAFSLPIFALKIYSLHTMA